MKNGFYRREKTLSIMNINKKKSFATFPDADERKRNLLENSQRFNGFRYMTLNAN